MHDGQSATPVLDKQTRRYLFQNIDVDYKHLCFVFKNPFLNEVFVCYPALGSTVCDQAMVWNYVDKTVSFRQLPNLNHANYGPVDTSLSTTWDSDSDAWLSDLTSWNSQGFTPDNARVILAPNVAKFYLLDGSASFDGTQPEAYLERRGLSFGDDTVRKLVRRIRPRITGNVGETVLVYIGGANDPYADPTYNAAITYTIGTTVSCDGFANYRYPAIKFASGTSYQWRLDSYDADVVTVGAVLSAISPKYPPMCTGLEPVFRAWPRTPIFTALFFAVWAIPMVP